VRKGERKVALVPADELAGLIETAHLLRSPKNAQRLLTVLRRAVGRKAGQNHWRNSAGDGTLPRALEREAVFHPEFRQDLRYWVETDRRVAIRAFDLIEAVLRDPFVGIGKPEPLKYLLAGCWSRRITQEHRLVYSVRERRIDFCRRGTATERELYRDTGATPPTRTSEPRSDSASRP